MARMTPFRALRGFRFRDRDVVVGELLELTDDDVQALVWMIGTIALIRASDRRRVQATPRVTWEAARDDDAAGELRAVTRIGRLAA